MLQRPKSAYSSSDRPYSYKTLKHKDSIRLIRLQPARHITDKLRADLLVCRLGDNAYEALSYTWGEAVFPEVLQISGFGSLSITENLASGLGRLRFADKPRLFWADAVCIDQSNDGEKDQQLALIGNIFAQASAVRVWLGDGESRFMPILEDASIKMLESADARMRGMGIDKSDVQTHHVLARPSMTSGNTTKPEGKYLDALYHFTHLPWFSSAWIVQEVVLAQQYRLGMAPAAFETSQYYDFSTEVLVNMQIRGCKEPKDRLFSILDLLRPASGLVRGYDDSNRPHYGMGTLEVYTYFVGKGYKTLSEPDILYDAGIWRWYAELPHKDMSAFQESPSWLPPYDRFHFRDSLTVLHPRYFRACKSMPRLVEWEYTVAGKLRIRGFVLDRLTSQYPVEVELPSDMHRLRNASEEQLMRIRDFLRGSRNDSSNLLTSLLHCISFDFRDDYPASKSFARYLLSFWNYPNRVIDQDTTPRDPNHQAQWTEIYYTLDRHSLFVTANRGLGIGVKEARGDDVIAVFDGAAVPYILRPTGDRTHQLVGPCYVDGIMYGEGNGFLDREREMITLC